MKQLMNRKIELILIFVLAAAIVAVSCLGPWSEPVTYVPQKMPDELAAEIEKAWYLKEYEHIDLDDSFYRYYGTYGDCVVYFESGPQGENETKWIAWRKFTYRYSFEIRVYCNGEFSTLEEAYADGLLSRKQVSLIADCHKQAESMASVTDGAAVKNDVPDRYPGTVSEEFAELWQEVQKAWLEENGWELNETRYYGTYGDCVVLFGAGVQQAVETKLIAGEEFTYNRSFALEVYQGGEFTILEQAYAHGLVSKEQVSLIAEYHRLAEEYRNGVN